MQGIYPANQIKARCWNPALVPCFPLRGSSFAPLHLRIPKTDWRPPAGISSWWATACNLE